jgi:hypothetical protein
MSKVKAECNGLKSAGLFIVNTLVGLEKSAASCFVYLVRFVAKLLVSYAWTTVSALTAKHTKRTK